MFGWHHWLSGPECEQAPRDSEGQGNLVCCSPRGCKELDTPYWLKNNNKGQKVSVIILDHSAGTRPHTAAQALGLLISWTSAIPAGYLGLRSPGVAHSEEQALRQPRQDGHLPVSDPAAFSTIGTLETWSPEVGTSGLALPPWQAAHQESQATHPALLVSVQSSPFLQNHSLISLPIPQPELSLPSSLIPHTFTGTVGHESLPSVKVIFSCFKKSTYSSYYSEDEKNLPLFLA